MTDDLDPHGVDYLTSFLFAASEYIFPQIRLVSMEWNRHSVDVYFYVDGQFSEDDEEALNLIGTYFQPELEPSTLDRFEEHIIRVDYPAPISFQGQCVFARRETPPIGKIARGIITERWLSRFDKVCVAIQRAMVGNIFPQIRHIVVKWDEETASIYFRVHGELLSDDYRSIDQIVQYFCLQFPKEEMVSCEKHVIRMDFPEVPKDSLGTLVYGRKEYCSNHPSTPYPFLVY
jgi:hypothetical protein